jgi:hypothetical protein
MTAIQANYLSYPNSYNPLLSCNAVMNDYMGTPMTALTGNSQGQTYFFLYNLIKKNQLFKNATVNSPVVIEEKVKEVNDSTTTDFVSSNFGVWSTVDTDSFEMSLDADTFDYLDTVAFDFENGEFSFEDAEFSFDVDDLLLESAIAQEKVYEKPTYFDANIQLINTKFDKEYLKYSNYISSDKAEALNKVKELSTEIANVKFENIVVELSPLNTVKFKIKIDSSKMLIITSPFNPSKDMQDNVFFSLLIDGEIVVTEVLNLTSLLDGFNKYVSA